MIATRANRSRRFGVYVADPHDGVLHANGLVVLTLAGDRIAAMTRFDNTVLPPFGLPRTLPLRSTPAASRGCGPPVDSGSPRSVYFLACRILLPAHRAASP